MNKGRKIKFNSKISKVIIKKLKVKLISLICQIIIMTYKKLILMKQIKIIYKINKFIIKIQIIKINKIKIKNNKFKNKKLLPNYQLILLIINKTNYKKIQQFPILTG